MNADEIEKAKELVMALRTECSDCSERNCCNHGNNPVKYCPVIDAADIIGSLTAQLNEANANGIIQERIIESGRNPHDADKIVRLTMDNTDLKRQLAASQRRAQDARNELCQKCGRYRDAHKGACYGCRWMA